MPEQQIEQAEQARETLLKTFAPRIWQQMEQYDEQPMPSRPEHEGPRGGNHRGHGICPYFLGLMILQIAYLVTLIQLKKSAADTAMLKKAKKVVVVKKQKIAADPEAAPAKKRAVVRKIVPSKFDAKLANLKVRCDKGHVMTYRTDSY